jgi:hypothetical protein
MRHAVFFATYKAVFIMCTGLCVAKKIFLSRILDLGKKRSLPFTIELWQ